jgi:transposase-like protein
MGRVMGKRDARSLDHATLEEMRRLAVRRVVEGGETQAAVAHSLEVHPVTVAKWVGTYRRVLRASRRRLRQEGAPLVKFPTHAIMSNPRKSS